MNARRDAIPPRQLLRDVRYVHEQVMPCAAEEWRRHTAHSYVMPYEHRCREGVCRLETLYFALYTLPPSYVDKSNGTLALVQCTALAERPSDVLMAAAAAAASATETDVSTTTTTTLDVASLFAAAAAPPPPLVHLCLPQWCAGARAFPHEHAEQRLCWRETSLSMCVSTGATHVCSDTCMEATANDSDLIRVCRLTGFVGATRHVDPSWRPYAEEWNGESAAYAAMHAAEAPSFGVASESDRTAAALHIIFAATSDSEILAVLSDRKRAGHGALSNAAQSRRGDYYVMACGRIAMLFTREHLNEVAAQRRAAELEACAAARTYVDAAARSNVMIAITDLVQLVARMRAQSNTTRLARSLPDDMRVALIRDWASRCVRFWYLLRVNTTLGRETCNKLPFYDFIDVALRIFADGLVVPPSDATTDLALVADGVAPHAWDAAYATVFDERTIIIPSETLVHVYIRYASTTNASGNADTSTKMKKRIQIAVIDAVRRRGVPPSRMRLDSVTIEQCEQEAFVPLVRPKSADALRDATLPKRKRKRA